MNSRRSAGSKITQVSAIIGVVAILVTVMFPALNDLRENETGEIRSEAAALAHSYLGELRLQDPGSWPSQGKSGVKAIEANGRSYQLSLNYCGIPAYCSPRSRHILLTVTYQGKPVYNLDTVFMRAY